MRRRASSRIAISSALAVALAMAGAPQESIAQDRVDPGVALWMMLKKALTAPDGQSYFDMGMKGAMLPTLKGKVVSLEPETDPTTIVLAIENGVTPDATLKFEKPLKGRVDEATELAFEGVGESFTADPFMVVFDVDADHLHGWPDAH
jgi:hypothetical protein